MNKIILSQLNTTNSNGLKVVLPNSSEEPPVSATEKLVREEIRKLTENAEEISKLKRQLEKQLEKEAKAKRAS